MDIGNSGGPLRFYWLLSTGSTRLPEIGTICRPIVTWSPFRNQNDEMLSLVGG
jgi:hypothetical protein